MQLTKKTTLSYLVKDDKVLMIKHKRGRGIGYVNLPGGKQDAGETIEQTAIRETIEETGIKTKNNQLIGKLGFHFADGKGSIGHVFICDYEAGELKAESDEVIPMWIKEDEVPLDKMWDADKYWFQFLKIREKFYLNIFFDENYKVRRIDVLDVNF
tara:strand:+ start:1620 stop:2087 length:468 start_codon:yes stop_codon:yes gene_type:complete